MSVNSRKKAIIEFDISKVIEKHLFVYKKVNNFLNHMKILITGVAGFVGFSLAKELLKKK